MSNDLHNKIDELLKNEIVERHSYFQLKYFIVGKEPTTQARMWRCLNELKARKEAIDSILLEQENLRDDLELLTLEQNDNNFGFDIPEKIKEIQLRKHNRKKVSMETTLAALDKKLQFAEEEAEFFVKAFINLSSIEKLKPYDDMESQIRYWNEKLSQDLNTKVMLGLPVDSELMRTILALPDTTPVKQAAIAMTTTNRELPNETQEGTE